MERDASLPEQMAYVRNQVDRLLSDLGQTKQTIADVRRDLTALGSDAERQNREVRDALREVAIGSIRLELLGLLLVGVGTVIGVLG